MKRVFDVAVDDFASREGGGSGHDAGADGALEVALDPLGHGVGAAVGLETAEIETEALDAFPQVRVAFSPARASRRKKEPGILPAA